MDHVVDGGLTLRGKFFSEWPADRAGHFPAGGGVRSVPPPPRPFLPWKRIRSMPSGRARKAEPTGKGPFSLASCFPAAKRKPNSKAGQAPRGLFPGFGGKRRAAAAKRFVLDGEIVVPAGRAFSFDDLLQRIHPRASRVAKLAQETPALLIAFDLLADERGASLLNMPLRSGGGSWRRLRRKLFVTASGFRPRPRNWRTQKAGSKRSVRRSTASSPSTAMRPMRPASATRW